MDTQRDLLLKAFIRARNAKDFLVFLWSISAYLACAYMLVSIQIEGVQAELVKIAMSLFTISAFAGIGIFSANARFLKRLIEDEQSENRSFLIECLDSIAFFNLFVANLFFSAAVMA